MANQWSEEFQLSAVHGNLPFPAKVTMEILKVDSLAGHWSAVEIERKPEVQRRLGEKRSEPFE